MRLTNISMVAVMVLLSAAAFAGQNFSAPVQIDFENRSASGDMRSARNSENPYEQIGCVVRYFASGTPEVGVLKYAFCIAAVGELPEESIICVTGDEELVEAVNSVADYAFVTFGWNETNECTRLGFSVRSTYLPASIEEKKNKDKDKL